MTVSRDTKSTYEINKVYHPVAIDANWGKAVWEGIPALNIDHWMGEKPKHKPVAKAKILYDDEAIYLIFQVKDNFVRAVASEMHGAVWCDSCVEFFFTPAAKPDSNYFNLEMNCGGTFLFDFNSKPRQGQHLAEADCQQIQVAHTLPKIIDPEIVAPTTWCVEYRLPFSIISKYGNVTRPTSGDIWRANFYKCADQTSHPHWLTWAKVDQPTPDFHLPKYFGKIKFK